MKIFATAIGLAATLAAAGALESHAETAGGTPAGLPPELEQLRTTMEQYQDPLAAVHDGYLSTVACVALEDGGMGVHFLNPALLSPEPDPMRPPVLVYAPEGEDLRLVAVEWLVPVSDDVEGPPELFGQAFEGPMEGHEPLMPADLHHYDLHAWIFQENPAGLFHHTHPEVSCEGEAYAVVLEPSPAAAHD